MANKYSVISAVLAIASIVCLFTGKYTGKYSIGLFFMLLLTAWIMAGISELIPEHRKYSHKESDWLGE